MSSLRSSASPDASPPLPQTSKPEHPETPTNSQSQPPESSSESAAGGGVGGELEGREVGDGEEEEEEGECGFCLFMKGGGCKESFVAWEECVAEAEKNKEDVVEKCFEVTSLLKKCMDAHADYYAPILQAEKAMEEEAARELGQVSEDEQVNEGKGEESVREMVKEK